MLLTKIKQQAKNKPKHIALKGLHTTYTYHQLYKTILELTEKLNACKNSGTFAIALNNSPAWVILDIAAMSVNWPCVPLPHFFSSVQLIHAIQDGSVSTLITDTPEQFELLLKKEIINKKYLTIGDESFTQINLNYKQNRLPADTAKITYTSGTTGTTKGVCISKKAMLDVGEAISNAVKINDDDIHLSILPLATLLENVAGVYATLLGGGMIYLYPQAHIGLDGNQLNIANIHKHLSDTQATTAIVIPEILKALTTHMKTSTPLEKLRFLAVGGAHVAHDLLGQARKLNLPIFEGYGLSESASVVTLNTPEDYCDGSVGKPLPHLAIKLNTENEMLIKGANFLGYTHQASQLTDDGYYHTGDIGYCDDNGFWFINGRKKNMFITSFGRNLSPEWVEAMLNNTPDILQSCLFGEAKPWNTALIVARPETTTEIIDSAISNINQQLPDYARVSKWLLSHKPFTVKNKQLTSNGRLKRKNIWETYQDEISSVYTEAH